MKNILTYFNEIYSLLQGDQKKIPFILFLYFILACLDVVSLGILGPYVSIIISDESNNQLVDFVTNQLNNYGYSVSFDQVFVIFSIILILSFFFKLIIGVYATYKTQSFALQRSRQLIKLLISSIFLMPYKEFVKKNSADYLNITEHCTDIYSSTLNLILDSIARALVIVGMLSVVIYTNFKITLILLLIFIIPSLIYYFFARNKIRSYGIINVEARQQMIKLIISSIKGLKEIKIFEKEEIFKNVINKYANLHALNLTRYSVVSSIPRPSLELFIVIALVAFVSFVSQINLISILPLIIVYLFVGVRILPFITTVINLFVHLRFNRHAIHTLYLNTFNDNLFSNENKKNDTLEGTFEKATFDRIDFKYEGDNQRTFEIEYLEIKKGEIVGLFGPSGSGKSTFINLLLGFLEPGKGEIKINNMNLQDIISAWRSKVAYIPQEIFLVDDSIEKNITLYENDEEVDLSKLNNAIKFAHLNDFIDSLPQGYKTIIGENGARLSGGQRQRIALARSYYHDRDFIIMDEATNALDKETENKLIEEIKNLGGIKTIIIVSHHSPIANICDKVFEIKSGKIELNL